MYQSVHNEWDLFDSNTVIDVLIDYVNYLHNLRDLCTSIPTKIRKVAKDCNLSHQVSLVYAQKQAPRHVYCLRTVHDRRDGLDSNAITIDLCFLTDHYRQKSHPYVLTWYTAGGGF